MPSPQVSSSSTLADRTSHACAQCRRRKHKCGGFTSDIKCRPCTKRKVNCSFENEVHDERYNPYLRLRRHESASSFTEAIDREAPPTALQTVSRRHTGASGMGLASEPSSKSHNPNPPTQLSTASASISSALPDREHWSTQIQSLKARIQELESRPYSNATQDNSVVAHQFSASPHNQAGRSSSTNVSALSPSHNYGTSPNVLSSIEPQVTHQVASQTQGPLKTLNNFQTEAPLGYEVHDPISRSILTLGEAHVLFRLYFSKCHPNAPFLDLDFDSDVHRVRSSSILLFVSILCIGARFWGASSRASRWLHPRYPDLVRLLDAEMMRVTLRPGPDDQRLETIQGLMLCAHWMPFEVGERFAQAQSRFSEEGAWQCLGLAIRWAVSMALERSCHISFRNPDKVTLTDVRRFRTMLYLVESDQYLALSARRPSSIKTGLLNEVLHIFMQSQYTQNTDIRVASLFRVAHSANMTNCLPTTIESVEAFHIDVQLVEQDFAATLGLESTDSLSQHFPFTSLRWYQLSYTCAFLDGNPTQQTSKALTWSIEWARQILTHMSTTPSQTTAVPIVPNARLEPNPSVVDIMSFAIDHYFVAIAYAAYFLVNSWLNGHMDFNFLPRTQQAEDTIGDGPVNSLLYRLVDAAARTFEAASPSEGHLARRYVPILHGMAGIVLSSNMQTQRGSGDSETITAHSDTNPEQVQNHWEAELWEIWQQAGLDATFYPRIFDETYPSRPTVDHR